MTKLSDIKKGDFFWYKHLTGKDLCWCYGSSKNYIYFINNGFKGSVPREFYYWIEKIINFPAIDQQLIENIYKHKYGNCEW